VLLLLLQDSGKASRTKVLVNAGIRINTNRSSSSSSSPHHGVEPLDRFVPVEHPSEPFDIDQPMQCPQTEPGIMHVSNNPALKILLKLY
jgi:hypothetical protein